MALPTGLECWGYGDSPILLSGPFSHSELSLTAGLVLLLKLVDCSVAFARCSQNRSLTCFVKRLCGAVLMRGGRGGVRSERKNAFLAMLQKDTVPRTLVVMEDPLYCVIINLISGLCVCVLTEVISSSYQRQEREGWTAQSKLHIVIVPAVFSKDCKEFSKQKHIFFCLSTYLSLYFYISVCLSVIVYPSIYLSSVSVYLCLSIYPLSVSVCLCIYLSSLSVSLSFDLSVYK